MISSSASSARFLFIRENRRVAERCRHAARHRFQCPRSSVAPAILVRRGINDLAAFETDDLLRALILVEPESWVAMLFVADDDVAGCRVTKEVVEAAERLAPLYRDAVLALTTSGA